MDLYRPNRLLSLSAGSDDQPNRRFAAAGLGSDSAGTESAEVFILVTLRQHQQQALAHGDRPTASRTKELRGIEILECAFIARGLRHASRRFHEGVHTALACQ